MNTGMQLDDYVEEKAKELMNRMYLPAPQPDDLERALDKKNNEIVRDFIVTIVEDCKPITKVNGAFIEKWYDEYYKHCCYSGEPSTKTKYAGVRGLFKEMLKGAGMEMED